jgi:murein DD-endopeptidase MepM/ murein hydrolase activator NlpD
VGSDQAQEAQLESRIAQQGAVVQSLVASFDQAQTHEALVQAQLSAAQLHLSIDRIAQSKATAVLRRIALYTYMSGADSSSIMGLFEGGDAASVVERQEYTGVVGAKVRDAIDAVEVDEQQTQSAEAVLSSAQAQAEASVQQLALQRKAAQSALDNDNALLATVQGNLQTLLAAIAQQREAAEEAEEQEMAEQAAAVLPPVTVLANPTPGQYANPLRGVGDLFPERVDQGVDYSGAGPIFAVGDGVVLSTDNSGWPGGTFISYRLTDGPADGLVVYAAEDIDPVVSVGQVVTASTELGTMYEGPDGIETGWADPSGDGVTMARDYGQFSGANSTAFGANFSDLLAALGAPPGVMQNNPPTGTLPPNWPQW